MTDRIERTTELPAAPAEVWRALTDPAWLAGWLAEEAELDLRPGGEARFVVDGQPRTGWVEEVLPPTPQSPGRLSFWWQADEAPASRVSFELEATEREVTRLRIVETRPLELLDLVGIPLRSAGGAGGATFGPALVAA